MTAVLGRCAPLVSCASEPLARGEVFARRAGVGKRSRERLSFFLFRAISNARDPARR